MPRQTTRRAFLKSTTATAALPLILTAQSGLAASDKLNIAAVGVAGKGRSDIANTSVGQNVVAICDVDKRSLEQSAKLYSNARVYTDWRKMLEQKDIDAVTVSTPDHMHAPVAVSAMQLGKHVYVQKPLAHTVYEARQMRKVAEQYDVVSQMGNQGHSGTGYRTVVQLVQSGLIGKVKEVHAWSDRPIWPQGVDRPTQSHPVPDWLEWDNWIGVASFRPYVGPTDNSEEGLGVYHPFNWRGWLDFGVGALGDMGCHIIDPVVWSLDLQAPRHVWSDGPATNGETFPEWEIIHYEFPGTKYTVGDTVRMTWHDGGKKPPQELAQLTDGEALPDNGSLYIGEKGVILCPLNDKKPRLLPEKDFADYEIDFVSGSDHYLQWTEACKGNGKATSHFDYSGPLTETVLLGTIAIRFPGQKLNWNSSDLKFSQNEANQYVHHAYREGWEVKGL